MGGVFWSPGMTLKDIEEQVIEAALSYFHNNKTVTAEALGISLRTLHNKLGTYAEEVVEEVAEDTPVLSGQPLVKKENPKKRSRPKASLKKKAKGSQLSAQF